MCLACGCGDPHIVPVSLNERILAANDRAARHNRDHFREAGVSAINLMGSPGAGKTAVLEATARALGSTTGVGVLAGDLATDNDAQRIRAAGMIAESITTGTACHLDAEMVHQGLHRLGNWRSLDYLFIENVGNLVCPAVYGRGQDVNVVALSVTEGEDKPIKYPVMFHKADLVLISKVDLLPHLPEIDVDRIVDSLRRVMPDPRYILISARTGQGMAEWVSWLRRQEPGRSSRATHDHPGHAHA